MLQKQKQKIAILPLGAHEYHGPHLPFETDWLIAEGIVASLKKQMPAYLDISFLKVEKIGYSIEHADRAGTKTLSYDEALRSWIGIGKRLFQGKNTKLLLLNAHGGNSPLLSVVTTELRCAYNMLAVTTNWSRFGYPEGLISDHDKAFDIHGGFIETSVMLALHPKLVDMTKAQDYHNNQQDFARDYTYLRAYGPQAFGWKMRDLNPQGAAGNALKANQEAGIKIIDHATKGIITLLEDMHRFDVSTLA